MRTHPQLNRPTQITRHLPEEPNSFLAELPAANRTVSRCGVCGFTEIFTDEVVDRVEVVDRGRVLLAECPHCEHRWTESLAGPLAISAPAPRATAAPAQLQVPNRRRAPVAA